MWTWCITCEIWSCWTFFKLDMIKQCLQLSLNAAPLYSSYHTDLSFRVQVNHLFNFNTKSWSNVLYKKKRFLIKPFLRREITNFEQFRVVYRIRQTESLPCNGVLSQMPKIEKEQQNIFFNRAKGKSIARRVTLVCRGMSTLFLSCLDSREQIH